MNVGFERIVPTPGFPPGLLPAALAGLPWTSRVGAVIAFKQHVKPALYSAQVGRCCFCRRVLMDDSGAHLEHFVDKAQYQAFTFEIRNLALACPTCNVRKNGHFAALAGRLRREAARAGAMPVQRCPVLTVHLAPGAAYPIDPAGFRWVNPHVDDYSAHITWSRGWVFSAKTRKGLRTIRGVRLNGIAELEQRALSARLSTRGGMLSFAVGAIAELSTHTAREVGLAVAREIARRRAL